MATQSAYNPSKVYPFSAILGLIAQCSKTFVMPAMLNY